MKVSRGLLKTGNRSPLGRSKDADLLTSNRLTILRTDPLKGYHWRETYQWASRLVRGEPDLHGRRLFSDASRSNARYVARVAHRASLGHELPPTPRKWSLFEASMTRVYEELLTSSPSMIGGG